MSASDHAQPSVAGPPLHGSVDELRLLYEAGARFGCTLDPAQVFSTMRELVAAVMDCDGLLVSSYSTDERLIRCSHAWVEGEFVDAAKFPAVRLNPDGNGMQSRVIVTGQPLVIGDVEAYVRVPGTRYYYVDPDGTVHGKATEDEHSHSAMMVPITLDGTVLGVVQVTSNRRSAYDARDLRIFGALTAQMAAASRNAALFQQAQRELTARREIEAALRVSEQSHRDLVATLEQRVAERTAELEASHDKMVDFSYTVSHDLRTPIRAIRGYLDVILEELGHRFDETGLEYARRIIDATKRMDQLIVDLLTYSRIRNAEMAHEPVPLLEVVHEAVALGAAEFEERGVQLHLELGPVAPTIVAHRATLVQVLWNVLENAARFVPEARIPRIVVRAEERDSFVRVWVEDNGIGIAPEHRDRVFLMFQRLHAGTGGGTGVGLAMVKKAIERMGGDVGVESELGTGSRFWLELPRA
jgi:signal transduction histidine kinase